MPSCSWGECWPSGCAEPSDGGRNRAGVQEAGEGVALVTGPGQGWAGEDPCAWRQLCCSGTVAGVCVCLLLAASWGPYAWRVGKSKTLPASGDVDATLTLPWSLKQEKRRPWCLEAEVIGVGVSPLMSSEASSHAGLGSAHITSLPSLTPDRPCPTQSCGPGLEPEHVAPGLHISDTTAACLTLRPQPGSLPVPCGFSQMTHVATGGPAGAHLPLSKLSLLGLLGLGRKRHK